MATIPEVIIKIGGVPVTSVSDAESVSPKVEDHLYMTYVEAVNTESHHRQQYLIFPPICKELGLGVQDSDLSTRSLARRQGTGYGMRTRWGIKVRTPQRFGEEFETLVEFGFTISEPILIPLELEDYLEFYNTDNTPTKALRHVDKVLSHFNISLKEF